MKTTEVISVNPGKTALGHVEDQSSSIFRSQIIGVENIHHIDMISFLFPTANAGVSEYKKYDAPLRTLFATILIVTGLSLLTTSAHMVGFAICTLCFGSFLALGLLTRITMLGAAIFYCIFGALSIRAGVTDITSFSLMFGCLVFAVAGSGKYSCDTLIRKAVSHHNHLKENKRRESLMGYKAFHSI